MDLKILFMSVGLLAFSSRAIAAECDPTELTKAKDLGTAASVRLADKLMDDLSTTASKVRLNVFSCDAYSSVFRLNVEVKWKQGRFLKSSFLLNGELELDRDGQSATLRSRDYNSAFRKKIRVYGYDLTSYGMGTEWPNWTISTGPFVVQ